MSAPRLRSAAELGLVACRDCGRVCRDRGPGRRCPRCFATLHRRKPRSLDRTLAFMLSAVALYVPANLLTIMSTESILGPEEHTIFGGVIELWQAGSWDLAVIVFIASICVPVLKLTALGILWLSTVQGSGGHARPHTRLYRLVELVGHWSMLDVFVVALMMALVQFGSLATVHAGPGIVAFGAVVVLTMLASKSFDPRLLWDSRRAHINALREARAGAAGATP